MSYMRARSSSGTRLRSESDSSSRSRGSRRSSAEASCSGLITALRASSSRGASCCSQAYWPLRLRPPVSTASSLVALSERAPTSSASPPGMSMWSRRIADAEGSSCGHVSGCHRLDRMNALAQWMNASSTSSPMPRLRHAAVHAEIGQQRLVPRDAGPPLHAQRLAQPGDREEQRRARVIEKVAMRVERGDCPGTRARPGDDRRGFAKAGRAAPRRRVAVPLPHWPSRAGSNGERAMKSRQCSIEMVDLLRTGGDSPGGGGTTSRSSASLAYQPPKASIALYDTGLRLAGAAIGYGSARRSREIPVRGATNPSAGPQASAGNRPQRRKG